MRKIKLFVLGLLLSCSLNAQKSEEMVIAPELYGYAVQFVAEGLDRGLNLSYDLFRNVDTLKFDHRIFLPNVGYYNPATGIVGISSQTLIDSLITKSTVFHELAHAVIGGYSRHSMKKGDIMYYNTPDTFFIYANDSIWSAKLDDLYQWIKEQNRKKYEINR